MPAPPRTARRLVEQAQRIRAAEVEGAARMSAIEDELLAIVRGTERRLGIRLPSPCDPLLLDVLAMVENEGRGYNAVWHWCGPYTNKGTPCFRVDGRDRGTVRYLAVAFGLIDPDERRQLQPAPTRSQSDVNPYVRYIGTERLDPARR